ncbi:M48 family metallopeptidase [bacterium]|nr:M48 family metallopeptidase [bacterium]
MNLQMKNYHIVRTHRSTISLTINEEAHLIIRAPYHLAESEIEKFIEKKESWLKEKIEIMQNQIQNSNRFIKLVNNKTAYNIKKQAKQKLLERLEYLSEKYNYPYSKMRLSSAKTRWGSCSYKNTISLNWKIMFAPPQVVDYLIIHELVHTKHKNHKKFFWNAVKTAHPHYKEDKQWLRKNAYLLSVYV